MPQCLLAEGYLYNDKLKDTANAHKKYSELIEKYPNDHLAQDAKMEIKYLGKTPDEIGKMFEEQNKQKEGNKKSRS